MGRTPARRTLVGQRAELVAVDFLRASGFEIVDTNVRVGPLEIDVVARRGDLVAIVEVRTRGRGSYVGALGSIDARKRRNLLRAAARYWGETLSKDPTIGRMRIDVIGVSFENEKTSVEHIEAAIVAS